MCTLGTCILFQVFPAVSTVCLEGADLHSCVSSVSGGKMLTQGLWQCEVWTLRWHLTQYILTWNNFQILLWSTLFVPSHSSFQIWVCAVCMLRKRNHLLKSQLMCVVPCGSQRTRCVVTQCEINSPGMSRTEVKVMKTNKQMWSPNKFWKKLLPTLSVSGRDLWCAEMGRALARWRRLHYLLRLTYKWQRRTIRN